MRDSLDRATAQGAFSIHRPHRLKEIVAYARSLGASGKCDAGDAIDAIEAAIWGDGLVPLDRESQRRAWEVTRTLAMDAYSEGVREFLSRVAREAVVTAEGDHYRSLYITAWRAGLSAASEDEIVEAVDRALAEEGYPNLSGASPLFPVRRAMRARANGCDDELKSFDLSREVPAFIVFGEFEGEPAAAQDPDDGPQHDQVSEWAPLNLADPAAWLKPPEHVPGTLRSIAFDPDDETPPPAWLAKGLLPRAGIGLLFGESGSGKSFAAIHASLAVAWGLPLFGAKTKQGAVLYIAAEGGSSVRRRMRAANKELEPARAAANFARPAGADPHIRAPITIVTEAPDLSRDGDVKPLLRTIEAAKTEFARAGHRLALVVIDTWHAAMGGADENSAADAGHALKPLIASSEDGDFLTLIVHHPGKDVEKGARGSNALPAAADAILAVNVPGFMGARAKPAGAPRNVTVTKMRDGDAGREFGYRLRIVPTGVDEDGDLITTCVVEAIDPPKVDAEGLTRSGREFMDAVEQAVAEEGGERARLETARLMFYAARSNARPDAKRKAWTRALDAALTEGRVTVDDHNLAIWLNPAPAAGHGTPL